MSLHASVHLSKHVSIHESTMRLPVIHLDIDKENLLNPATCSQAPKRVSLPTKRAVLTRAEGSKECPNAANVPT